MEGNENKEANQTQNKENLNEKKEEEELKKKLNIAISIIAPIILLVFSIWLFFYTKLINNIFEFIFRGAPSWNVTIIKISAVATILTGFLYFYFKNKTIGTVAAVCLTVFIGSILIGLLSKPVSSVLSSVTTELDKAIFRPISVSTCKIMAEMGIGSKKIDECDKNYKKLGSYKGLEINFGYVKDPQNIIVEKDDSDVFVGRPYNLQLVLINKNTAPSERAYESTYDIKVKEIYAKASGQKLDVMGNQYIFSEELSVDRVIRSGRYVPLIINFDSMPTNCVNTMYFEVIVITEQTSKGVFNFYVNPNVDITDNIKFQGEILTSPGPLDVVGTTVPDKILGDQTDFTISLNMKNFGEGTAKIQKGKIVFGVDYLQIKSCNLYGNNIPLKPCNEEKLCYELPIENIISDYDMKKGKSLSIYCDASVIKSNYDEKDSTVTGAFYVDYSYKTTASTAKTAMGCVNSNIVTQNTFAQVDRYCREPDICRRECPEGYVQISGICNQIDTVCCRNIESSAESSLVAFHPTAGVGYFTSCFGWRTRSYFHSGIDLGVAHGTPIHAIQSGKVVEAGFNTGGFGNYVVIEHELNGNKYYSMYAHLSCSGITVQKDQYVNVGDVIGYSGGDDDCKGTSTGAHLHFEIRQGQNSLTNSVNPCLYLGNCGRCSSTAATCEYYRQYDRVDEYSGNCDDPLTP
ncbi:MAG: M23 family metallopeptidase [Candidatus Aenigmatarchaeota archaeon]